MKVEATRKALSLSELEACVKHYILLIKGGGGQSSRGGLRGQSSKEESSKGHFYTRWHYLQAFLH